MVLSNAERQRRFRQRLKAAARAATAGVTPEMIVRIARLLHETERANDPSSPSWEEYCRKIDQRTWMLNLPDDPETDWSDELGADADMARAVAAVVRAVKFPPRDGG
jgi:hypothetical protein